MSMPRTIAIVIAFIAMQTPAFAQGPIERASKLGGNPISNSQTNRKDFEGVIWEFKVIDSKTKKTESTGRFRIKEDALFLVRMKNTDDEKKKDGEKDADDKPKVKRPLAKKLEEVEQKVEENSKKDPTERIGEFDTQYLGSPGEIKFRFDKDDEYELSGQAVIKQTAPKSSIWSGYYDDDKKKRWKFELRKIEE